MKVRFEITVNCVVMVYELRVLVETIFLSCIKLTICTIKALCYKFMPDQCFIQFNNNNAMLLYEHMQHFSKNNVQMLLGYKLHDRKAEGTHLHALRFVKWVGVYPLTCLIIS